MSKEFKIGLITLISGVIMYYGFNYLKGTDLLSKANTYYVVYDNVDGLDKSNPVIINGFSVGKVSNITLMQEAGNKVLVELTISEDIHLGDSTVAELSNTDFLGSKAVTLKIGKNTRSLEPLDTLIAYVDRGLVEYLDNVQPITDDIGVTIRRINEILLGLQGSGEKITGTLTQLEITLKEVNDVLKTNRGEFRKIMLETSDLITSVGDRVDQLDPLLQKTNGVLDSLNNVDLNATLGNINVVMTELNGTITAINEGQGTLGQLMVNDSLYVNLNQLLIDLDELSIHFNNYPRDFLKPLGRKREKLEGIDITNN